MNKIEKLIQELCPEGVEWKTLGELFLLRNGYTPSKSNSLFWENGSIPWFRIEDIRENGRILSDSLQHITPQAIKGDKLFQANSFIVATSATIGEHALIKSDFLCNQRFTTLTLKKDYLSLLDIDFIFYYLFILDEWCKNNVNNGGFASVDMTKFRKFEIPIPPLPIQQEIVKILDSFTKYMAELQAELDARKEQYEYYRDNLLNFNKLTGGVF